MPSYMPQTSFGGANNPASSVTRTSTTTSRDTESLSGHHGLEVPPTCTLRLRGQIDSEQTRQPRRRIQWADDVVDNEGMGKKSSKGNALALHRDFQNEYYKALF